MEPPPLDKEVPKVPPIPFGSCYWNGNDREEMGVRPSKAAEWIWVPQQVGVGEGHGRSSRGGEDRMALWR